jgi:hypothetical protein
VLLSGTVLAGCGTASTGTYLQRVKAEIVSEFHELQLSSVALDTAGNRVVVTVGTDGDVGQVRSALAVYGSAVYVRDEPFDDYGTVCTLAECCAMAEAIALDPRCAGFTSPAP